MAAKGFNARYTPRRRSRQRSTVGRARPSLPHRNRPWAPSTNIAWQTPKNPPTPMKGQPAPGTPGGPPAAAPAAPVGAGFVPDAAYNSRMDLARRDEAATMGDLDRRERETRHEFGIDDPTNPNSRMATMKALFLRAGRSSTNRMASRGQLYSGTHQSQVAHVRSEGEKAESGLRKEYEGLLSEIRTAREEAKRRTEEAGLGAMEDWQERQGPADYYEENEPAAAPAAPGAQPRMTPAQRRRAARRVRPRPRPRARPVAPAKGRPRPAPKKGRKR